LKVNHTNSNRQSSSWNSRWNCAYTGECDSLTLIDPSYLKWVLQ